MIERKLRALKLGDVMVVDVEGRPLTLRARHSRRVELRQSAFLQQRQDLATRVRDVDGMLELGRQLAVCRDHGPAVVQQPYTEQVLVRRRDAMAHDVVAARARFRASAPSATDDPDA